MCNSMIVIRRDSSCVHFICPGDDLSIQPENGTSPCDTAIKAYYSEKHAIDSGWVKTKDVYFCGPRLPYVWVCPECAKKLSP